MLCVFLTSFVKRGSSFSNISRGEFDAYDTFLIPLANKINKNLEIYFLL